MNHGGIGVIEHLRATEGLRILFEVDILQTLSITDRSTMDGIFYPGRDKQGPKNTTVDFILSPIPFRLWPKVGRIRVRLLSTPGSIAEFSGFLAANGVSILHSEYSRSGYRFATWNFVVACDVDIDVDCFNLNETAYQPTLDALNTLGEKINREARHLLFEDKDDVRFRESLDIWPISPLAYFFHESIYLVRHQPDPWLYEEFTVEASSTDLSFKPAHRFTAILGNRLPQEISSRLCVYADISTTDVMMRLAVIPSAQQWRFSNLSVEYYRSTPPDTSRGFCAYITENLPEQLKIWKLTNYTKVNNDYSEIGGASLLLEDRRNKIDLPGNYDHCHQEITTHLSNEPFSVDGRHPFQVELHAHKLDSNQVWLKLKKQQRKHDKAIYRWDVFLSYSERDIEIANMLHDKFTLADLECFTAEKILKGKGGVNFSDEIREAIVGSREMVLLCSPNSIKSEWVISEWAAAWVLKKMVTPVLHQLSVDALPLRLKQLQYVEVYNFDEFVLNAAQRKQES